MAFVSQRETSDTYTFSSRPRVVENGSRYREAPPEQPHYGNIMYDRRVVRGNTYAQRILPTTTQAELAEMQRLQEQRRKAVARRRARDQVRVRTPEPLQGRQHTDVQTELYLEELSNTVMESDVQCQTDSFLDRPVTPLFVPAKSGVDAETQIQEGELFDFDREVQGLLEVLVGKVMEQSLLEVMEEEELASLRAQQRDFEEKRNAHLCEVQRLQEQERRHTEEKKNRTQQKEVLKREKEIAQKIAARAYTQQHLANLVPSIFKSLRCHGFFVDTVQTDVETNFLPWLMKEVHSTSDKKYAARSVLDDIINEVRLKRLPEGTNP
ncbi:radial spoke head protein 3 homolog [Boleophthalmus pectinirostris]|uniref:radial spoke head protein 3 homolog n=1 Tax=Boleophthalmus pectinirostris TaxID=150288 RepID=UPI002431B1A8|nr:radial spoke head protein 3 homolog [Boleophthalmus pectinirostris]